MTARHKIEYLATDSLVPYARNSRTHSDEQVAQIAGSIREFGFTNPVLVDGDKGIIAGHGRVMAASRLGLDEVPCIVLAHLTDAQKRAYVIADNKLALNAGWDEEMLALELEELESLGFDTDVTGFSQDEIDGLGDIDEVPIDGDTDESSPGADVEYLSFGGTRIPITDDERSGIEKLHDQYVDEYSMSYGFAAWLIEGRGK